MKQGDVISPLLLNSGLELAIGRWQARLQTHCIPVSSDGQEHLTNVRHAADLMLYALTLGDLCEMLEKLAEELSNFLVLNPSKTKILTASLLSCPLYVDVADRLVEVLFGSITHKYLENHLSRDLKQRSEIELQNRVRSAWGKFHKHRDVLLDRHIPVKLLSKLLQAVLTPTV